MLIIAKAKVAINIDYGTALENLKILALVICIIFGTMELYIKVKVC